jgi:hypothetical protein
MRHGKQIRARTGATRVAKDEPVALATHWKTDAAAALAPPPPAARSAGLENLRAGLLRCLARQPTVCRSIGLVR